MPALMLVEGLVQVSSGGTPFYHASMVGQHGHAPLHTLGVNHRRSATFPFGRDRRNNKRRVHVRLWWLTCRPLLYIRWSDAAQSLVTSSSSSVVVEVVDSSHRTCAVRLA